jgi:hypothetical protein
MALPPKVTAVAPVNWCRVTVVPPWVGPLPTGLVTATS